jgi:thiol:disulfide interchange protein DsbA
MLIRLLAVLLLLPIGACSAQPDSAAPAAAEPAAERQLGRDYVAIADAARFDDTDERIEVVEVFAYTCPHCATFEPLFVKWKEAQPADVRPVQVPMAFGGTGEAFARLFFAAQSMGELDKTHQATFDAFHVDHRQFGNLADVLAYYAELGVDRAAMESTLDSFPVNSKLAQTKSIVPRWGVEGTPSLIVDGRYRIIGGPEGGLEGTLETLDHVVALVRAERAESAKRAGN